MTRSAADAGAILQAIAGLDPRDPTTLAASVPEYLAGLDKGVRGLRIGVDTSYNEKDVDPPIVAAVRDTRKVLEDLGGRVKEVTLPDPSAVIRGWATVCGTEASLAHERTYPARASEYGPPVGGSIAGLIDFGRTVTGADYAKAHQARLAFAGALSALLAEVDLLLIPTQPRADFSIVQEADLFNSPDELAAFLRFATPFDMSGNPTITMPGGFTEKGLPVSFQLVGRHLDEALLIRAGNAYQHATDWHRRHPEV
jgi:amidase